MSQIPLDPDRPNPPARLNPYAPVDGNGDFSPRRLPVAGATVTSARVCLQLVGSIIISGGLFGVACVAVVAVWELASAGRFEVPELGMMFVFSPVVGAVMAACAAIVVVPAVFLIGFYFPQRSIPWSAPRIRWLTAIASTLSGIVCIFVPSLLEFEPTELVEVFLIGLIPGGFSLVVSSLLMERLARRARRSLKPLFDDRQPISQS